MKIDAPDVHRLPDRDNPLRTVSIRHRTGDALFASVSWFHPPGLLGSIIALLVWPTIDRRRWSVRR
jgi:hypothetical protein